MDEGTDGLANGLDDVGCLLVNWHSLVSLNNPDDAILYQSGTQGEDRCAQVDNIK